MNLFRNFGFGLLLFMLACLLIVTLSTSLFSKEFPGKSGDRSQFTHSGDPARALWNISNIAGWLREDGQSAHTVTGDGGVIFPRGTTACIYQDGVIWGGIVRDVRQPSEPQLRVGGQTYNVGTAGGWIIAPGTATDPPIAVDPSDNRVRMYRIRQDWQTLTTADTSILREVSERLQIAISSVTPQMAQEFIDQYALDWNEWPGDLGAPFIDVNGNGVWDPGTDQPGMADAAQVVWIVTNDLFPAGTISLYGSPPIGLELQITMWGYPKAGALGDMSFRRYRLINKSGLQIDSMFISQWSDPDIGEFTDDFVGCIPEKGLGYAYNGQQVDANYNVYGLNPPAAGYVLLQGPTVPSPGDTAWFDFQQRLGYKNLPLTSFSFLAAGSPLNDPTLGDYSGTLQWYNMLNGFTPTADTLSPTPYYVGSGPNTGQSTKFPLHGDPLTRSGDVDGEGANYAAGDRRFAMSTGPFYMQPGDTQEVVLAFVADIAGSGPVSYRHNARQLIRKAGNLPSLLTKGLAVDVAGREIAALSETMELIASVLLPDPNQTVTSRQWSLLDVPSGSSAQLVTLSADSAILTPDVPGSYRVAHTVTTSNGLQEQAVLEIQALNNSAPQPAFSFNPPEIIWGDTTLADAGASIDPDNDPLTFYWSGEGALLPEPSGEQTRFAPLRGGNIPLNLTVSDPFFGSEITRSVKVKPLLNDMEIIDTFVDTLWYGDRSNLFISGDTLMNLSISTGQLQVYNISAGGLTQLAVVPLPDVKSIQLVKNGRLYVIQMLDDLIYGSGPLTIFQIGPQWQLTPLLEDYYLPGNSEILRLKDPGNGFLVLDENNLYRIDMETDPANPIIEGQIQFPSGLFTRGFSFNETYIFASFRDPQIGSRIRIYNMNDLSYIAWVPVTNDFINNRVEDNLLTLNRIGIYGPGSESILIYDVQDPLMPIFKSTINIPAPIKRLENTESWYYSKRLEGTLWAVDDFNGITLFDLADPAQPQVLGSWYSGNRKDMFAVDGKLFLFDRWGQFFEKENPYSGINNIGLLPTSIDDDPLQRPIEFELSQNYPNPFNPETNIAFQIPAREKVELVIYNMLGQKVRTLVNETRQAGRYIAKWDGRNDSGRSAATGIYFYRLQSGAFSATRKVLLLK